ncbi:MAG: ATP-binding protein [Paludibacteraceae bacterium]|nr:ATP-binding protein [Paludibacteraceae bacterium]
MLLDFSVENYRSFYRKKTLDLQSQKLSEDAKENVGQELSYNVLKTLVVYGANSSGKSNLISALQMMEYCVLSSVKLNPNDSLPYEPFLLLKNNTKPSLFEVSFIRNGFCYRYGFSYTKTEIVDEWLFRKTTKRSVEKALFIREKEGIAFEDQKFPEGIGLESKVNNNRLFLSLCAQLGGEISNQVISWFEKDFNVASGLNNQNYRRFSKRQFHEKSNTSQKALDFFKTLRLGFNEILTREEETPFSLNFVKESSPLYNGSSETIKSIEIESVHDLYNSKGEISGSISFSFYEKESSGTQKLFDMSGPIFDTLEKGGILVVDELDAKMHPLISQQIIRLFNSPTTNPRNAQLIFSTHDTHLLSSKMLRRDQIWFTEKNEAEQTDLYCLTDIVLPDGSKPRNDANYEKNYIAGRYGAVPYIIND